MMVLPVLPVVLAGRTKGPAVSGHDAYGGGVPPEEEGWEVVEDQNERENDEEAVRRVSAMMGEDEDELAAGEGIVVHGVGDGAVGRWYRG